MSALCSVEICSVTSKRCVKSEYMEIVRSYERTCKTLSLCGNLTMVCITICGRVRCYESYNVIN